MLRSNLALLILVGLAGTAAAQGPPPRSGSAGGETPSPSSGLPAGLPPLPAHLKDAPTPKSPSPAIALASWNGGQVYLRSVFPIPKSATAGATAAGNAPTVDLASVAQPFDGRTIQARTADGKPVAAADLEKRLQKETPVLVGFAPMPPDPVYLQLARPETLLLILPAPPMPRPTAGAVPGRVAPTPSDPARETPPPARP